MPIWTKEQKDAIEKTGSNIIVSAGAGSGKTAVLSQRVLNKIENGIHVNELLILTFTNAAASEMKNRIRNKISKVEKYKNELDLINSAYITTFDSYALSIVKKYHYLLNISSDISITDDSIVVLQEKNIMDNIFESLYEEHNTSFEDMISNYCIKNDASLRKNILKLANNINNNINKDNYISFIKSTFFTDENIDKILNEYKELIKEKQDFIKLEIKNFQYCFNSDYVQKSLALISNIIDIPAEDLHLYTKLSLPRVSKYENEEQRISKKNLQEAIDELLEYSKYGTFDDIKNDILNSKKYILVIIDIVEKYINELINYKTINNIYTFNDIANLSIKVISENESIRNEIKNSFIEIMIDEYQDTNDVQDKFIKLIENNNVYMVGDIKQSIYKFRGSNPDIFKIKYDNYSINKDGIKIDLIKNFRSRNEVLNNINRIFELIMDDSIGGASYKKTHEMTYGNISYDNNLDKKMSYDINILEYNNDKNSDYTDSEIEIFTIVNDIKNKNNSKIKVFDKESEQMRLATYSDFVIILDRSRYFDDYKKIFEYSGIPLTILKEDKLNTNMDISLIRNIFDIIIRINNNDYGVEFKYDLMSIGRSFLYEYDDSYLFDLFYNNGFKSTKLFDDFSSIKSINSKTSSELFNEILNITDYYNKLNLVGDYENTNVRIKTIYEISNNLNELGYSIEDFKDYLDKIIEEGIEIKYNSYTSDTDSVKIMTIHGSKGLEYPICYFSDLDHEFNTSDLKNLFITDNHYGIIIPSTMEENKISVIKELYKYNYSKEEISEKIRLLYVAFTRAREKIVVVLPNKETFKYEKDDDGVIEISRRIRFTKLSDIIYAIKDYIPNYFSNVNISDISLTKNYLYKKEIENKIDNNYDNFDVNEINISNENIEESHFSKETVEIISKEKQENMKFGTKIHEMLEYINLKNYDESLIKDNYIRNKISKLLNNNLFKNISKSNIYHEYEFEYEKDNTIYHGIIDLMLEYSDHIDIVDFKLKNIKDINYTKQLKGYSNYIESISNKKINLYLYSIIDEEVYEIK